MAKNELYHYGIIGQKWGVRRYQNEDGSLTALGRERYGLKNLSIVNPDFHSDKGNANAVKDRKRYYKKIDKAEKEDKNIIEQEADEKFGAKNSAKKREYIQREYEKVVDAAYAARVEVDKYLNARWAGYAVASVKDDDVARGQEAVRKSEAQTNRIIAGIGLATLVGFFIKNSKSKKG